MSKVFVLDTNYKPLDPIHPGRARLLLSQGKASVFKRFPFTIILKFAEDSPHVEPLRVKIDPGSHTTGIAVINDATGEVVFAANLEHRGKEIKKRIDNRRAVRSGRRHRKTRYRAPRFQNRKRKSGWLPPSLSSRIANIIGIYVGRVAVRATGSFNITTEHSTIEGIGHRSCTILHKSDGYSYRPGVPAPHRPEERRGHSSPS